MIPFAVLSGSATTAESITSFSVPLESAGDGTCVDPVSVLATWVVSAGVTDAWDIQFYVAASTDTYPSEALQGDLVATELSPDSNTTKSVNLPLSNNPAGTRWYFRIYARLRDPNGIPIHLTSGIFTRTGFDC